MNPEKVLPVAQPVTVSEREQIARGLAEAAQALLKVANSLLAIPGTSQSFTEFAPVAASAKTQAAALLEEIRGGSAGTDSSQAGVEIRTTALPFAKTQVLPFDTRTVREAINEFLIVKARAQCSDRYLRTLRVSLCAFASGRANNLLHEVTAREVEKWIYGGKWRPKTMKGYLGDVRTLFHFAQKRGYVKECPPDAVELPHSDSREIAPGIHTPDEVRAVLESLRAHDLDVMRLVALRYFSGVRSAEAHRLREENLWIGKGLIEVPALKAKTRSRRLIKIQPCLAAWLALGGSLNGVCEERVREKIRLSGVPWKHNATRHSFVTYHYALCGDPKQTAREAGHSEEMLFANYRALATEDQGKDFFAIFPDMLV